jgi:hypothetical protein
MCKVNLLNKVMFNIVTILRFFITNYVSICYFDFIHGELVVILIKRNMHFFNIS